MKKHLLYNVVKIIDKPTASDSTLTNTTKTDIVTQLKKYNVASVRPEIVDPETTKILLTSNIKFDEKVRQKQQLL